MRKVKLIGNYDSYEGIDQRFESKVDCCTDKSCPTIAQKIQMLMNGGSIGQPIAVPSAMCYDFDETTKISEDALLETNDVHISRYDGFDDVHNKFDDGISTLEKRRVKTRSRASEPMSKQVEKKVEGEKEVNNE